MKTTIQRSQLDPTQFTLTFHRVGMQSRSLGMHSDDLMAYLRDSNIGEQTINAILGLPAGITVTLNVNNDGGDRALRRAG